MATHRLARQLPELSGCIWSFAGRTFVESSLELRVGDQPVELELKPLEVLLYLLRHAGEVVTKNELLDAVWPGLNVVEGSLSTAVYKLRKALGDADSSIVVTVPRVGYRLAATAHAEATLPSSSPAHLLLAAGSPVPGREQWLLLRPLDISPASEVWLAEHPKTHELRVFKFVSQLARLRTLKREVTVFRFLRESLQDRRYLVQILEWNFEAEPYFLESEYGGPNLAEWAEGQGGLAAIPVRAAAACACRDLACGIRRTRSGRSAQGFEARQRARHSAGGRRRPDQDRRLRQRVVARAVAAGGDWASPAWA